MRGKAHKGSGADAYPYAAPRLLYGINAPARSSLFFTASNVIAKGAALVFTPFFTRLLTTAEYGTYSLFLSYLSVITVTGSLEMGGSVIMRAFQKYRERQSTVILTGFLISVAATLISSSVLFVVKRSTGGELFSGAYALLTVSALCASLINLFSARCRFLYKPTFSLLLTALQSIITPILSISLISFEALAGFGHVAVKVGTATVISAVIALTLLGILIPKCIHELRANGNNDEKLKDISKLLLKLSLPMLPYYLSVMAISQLDKIFVSDFLGRDTLGMYSISYSAGIAPVCITGGLLGALCPWIMRKTRSGNAASVKETLSAVISLLCAVIICFLSAVPELLKILAPIEYLGTAPVTFIIALCPIPLFTAQLTSCIGIASERTLGTVLSGIMAAVISFASCSFFIPQFGASAAAASALAAYITLTSLGTLNARRITGYAPVYVNKGLRDFLLTATLSASIYELRTELIPRIIIGACAFICIIYMLLKSKRLLKETKEAS